MIHHIENINKDKLCKTVGIPYLKSIKSEKSIMEAHQQIQDGRRISELGDGPIKIIHPDKQKEKEY